MPHFFVRMTNYCQKMSDSCQPHDRPIPIGRLDDGTNKI